jgi:hypothetical protein
MAAERFGRSAISPANEKIAVSLASDQTFPIPAKGLYVGTGGTVIVRAPGSSADVSYVNVPNGGYIDGLITIVRSSANGTTASNLVADF